MISNKKYTPLRWLSGIKVCPPLWFTTQPGHTIDHHENGTNCSPARQAGWEFGNATRLQC